MTRTAAILAGLLALALGGCGISDPYNDDGSQRGERRARSTGGGDDARAPSTQALERFGEAWANWSARTLADNRRELAAQAGGDLRELLLRDARRADDERAVGAEMRNSGSVEGVLAREDGPILVIVREVAHFGDGGAQPRYVVYLARVAEEQGELKVTEWQPTS